MATINQIKQLAESDTPILFFQCTLPSGDVETWSTHGVVLNGQAYSARVLKHNLFDLQLSADDAMDGITQLSLTLANADSALSQLNRAIGFKGSLLTVYFAFADLPSSSVTTEYTVLFRGVAGDPDEITEDSLRLTFTNKLALQRIPVPEVRVQRSCPWSFPTTLAQRTEAKDGGNSGRHSRFYRCGYSPDVPNGVGNMNNGVAYTSCDGSRGQCQSRGMFSQDGAGHITQRFGGFEFVPSAVLVRTAGDKTSHLSPVIDNSAKYNDPVPIVYGTGWLKAPVIFSRNDGSLTHMEALLGMGMIQGVLKVVVDDVEIPQGVAGTDMTATGWYGIVTTGTRNGNFNLDFTDSHGNPLGDPCGSTSVLSVVVPNRISSGKSLPRVEVLLQGMQIDSYDLQGNFQLTTYSNNPAWVILDILRRCGWSTSEMNLASFANSALFCGTLINSTDLNGNAVQVSRYQCNLILTKRQSAASVIRGIRVASSLMLRYGATGLLELVPETTISAQQPALPDGSNSTETLNGGWPAYEFSDGSGPFSGIVRNANGSSSVRLSSRTVAETSNRLSVEFQDAANEYQQDSVSIVDANDSALIGYEISSQSTALGLANMSQATRVLLRQLDKSTDGNLFAQFQTSFRALKVRPGDIITLTYAKEGFERTPFRVVKLSPSMNYQVVTVLAQIHDDNWYSDNPAVLAGAGRQPGNQASGPRPLLGTKAHNDASGKLEYYDFGIVEDIQAQNDGSATDKLTVSFTNPAKPSPTATSIPLVSLSPQYGTSGGTLPASENFYYGITAVTSDGSEGPLSFTVPASTPAGGATNTVTLQGLSFPVGASAFNVYRGTSPQMLYRIAQTQSLSPTYTDYGAGVQPAGPPDGSFDHANFYYRFEYAGPFPVTSSSTTTIACVDMGAVPLAYSGMAVRVTEGTGRGQERVIATNDQTTLTVSAPWSVIPDASSTFVIAEPSWRFAAVGSSSPVQFQIPYQPGMVIQITGRAANVQNVEGAADLSPLTRCALGGGKADTGTTVAPTFSLAAPGAGSVTLSAVAFLDMENTSSVSSGTLQTFSWNELTQGTQYALAADIDTTTSTVTLVAAGTPYVGQVIQIGTELMSVLSVNANSNTYQVGRGAIASAITAHKAGDPVFHLDTATIIVPFALNYFGNRASQNYTHTYSAPDVRICGSQFFVTNAFGDSEAAQQCYTTAPGGGLRTLSGGQYSIQVAGTLATQTNAAPPLFIDATHAVRDVRASLNQSASGYDVVVQILQNGAQYCSCVVPSTDSTTPTSLVIDGSTLPPLQKASVLTINVSLQLNNPNQLPLSPGRDLTVTIRM